MNWVKTDDRHAENVGEDQGGEIEEKASVEHENEFRRINLRVNLWLAVGFRGSRVGNVNSGVQDVVRLVLCLGLDLVEERHQNANQGDDDQSKVHLVPDVSCVANFLVHDMA